MEIFAFKVGVGPNGPQQYLLGLMNHPIQNLFRYVDRKQRHNGGLPHEECDCIRVE